MPGFLGKVDGMDHVSVGFRGKSQYAFEVDLTYGDEIRLSTLKTLGQDLAARGFEKKTDFRPGESMSQVFMWDPYRHAEMKSDHE